MNEMDLLNKARDLTYEITLHKKPTLTSETIDLYIDNLNEEEISSDEFSLEEDIITNVLVKESANIPFPLDIDCEGVLDMILNRKAENTLESINTPLSVDDLKRFLRFYMDQRPREIQNLEKQMEDDVRHFLFTNVVEYASCTIDWEQPDSTPRLIKDENGYRFHAFVYLNNEPKEEGSSLFILNYNPKFSEFRPALDTINEPLAEVTLRFTLTN